MGSKSVWFERALLDSVFGNEPFPSLSNLYFALFTTGDLTDESTGADPGAVEVSGNGYARAAVANDLSNFPAATGGAPAQKTNAATVTFPIASGGSWGEVTQWALLDSPAPGEGNIYYFGAFDTPRSVLEGDTATFPPGFITITEH